MRRAKLRIDAEPNHVSLRRPGLKRARCNTSGIRLDREQRAASTRPLPMLQTLATPPQHDGGQKRSRQNEDIPGTRSSQPRSEQLNFTCTSRAHSSVTEPHRALPRLANAEPLYGAGALAFAEMARVRASYVPGDAAAIAKSREPRGEGERGSANERCGAEMPGGLAANPIATSPLDAEKGDPAAGGARANTQPKKPRAHTPHSGERIAEKIIWVGSNTLPYCMEVDKKCSVAVRRLMAQQTSTRALVFGSELVRS